MRRKVLLLPPASAVSDSEATTKSATMTRFLALVLLLPVISAVDMDRLEQIRLLHEHDGIDTATVHIAYPHLPSLRRLTKREAVENLLPRRHDNLTVKVTLNSSGRVLDLRLQPSKLQIHGALVTVLHQEGHESQFRVHDEGCHYQGLLDDDQGLASVHFCDGVLVGGAHTGEMEYLFHSHQHRLPEEIDDDITPHDPLDLQSSHGQDLYHTVVSWKVNNGSSFGDEDDSTILTDDYLEITKDEEDEEEEEKEEEEEEEEKEKEEKKERVRRQAVDPNTASGSASEGNSNMYNLTGPAVIPTDQEDEPPDTNNETNKVPVAEFGIIVDEHFLQDRKYLYPTRQDIIRMLMIKYTGVQALYGNPEVTGFNMIIQIKLLYLWEKNPPYYNGTNLKMGQRLSAGKRFSRDNPLYKAADVGTLFTSRVSSNVVGMAFLKGACQWAYKTYATRKYGLTWQTVSHEFGHTLGLSHVPTECKNTTSPYKVGFMNAVKSRFLPCYAEVLKKHMKAKRYKCLFKENVNTTNIPLVRLQSTFPVLAFGVNYYCRTGFISDAVYASEEDTMCGEVLCAVMDEANPMYGMANVPSYIPGRSCGPNGEVCLIKSCQLPDNITSIRARNAVQPGTWYSWSPYQSTCTSACGVGVQISSRQCSNRDRPETCRGPRHRARLCNIQPCPGDGLRTEQDIRCDRANYTCSLLHARGSNLTQYLLPYAQTIPKHQLWKPITMESCLVSCALAPEANKKSFHKVMQADGTLCGPVNTFDREVLGITTRCLRGRCVEFGCDGYSMEHRDGKVKDMCGVCGGDNSTCNGGQTTVNLTKAGDIQLFAELPSGTESILVTVQPNTAGSQQKYIKLGLMNKDSSNVIVPWSRGRTRIISNANNPLRFAGTHWTTLNNVILSAPGPIDQPMQIKVRLMGRSQEPVDVGIVWGYKLPSSVPPPPTCENGGTPNTENGGCMCAPRYHGRQCEYRCHDLCFNGGVMLEHRCRCNCSSNPRTNPNTRCGCLEGFSGPDCSECAIKQCYNNGTLNATTCKCECPDECQGKADCSACNYNDLLPGYRGQYGRGSLEDPLKPDYNSETTEQPGETTEQPGEITGETTLQPGETTKEPGGTSGQITVHKGSPVVHLSRILVVLWVSSVLCSLPHF